MLEKSMRKLFLILFPILSFCAIALFVLSQLLPEHVFELWQAGNYLTIALVIWAFYLMYAKGTLRYTIWRRLILIGISILIFGALFKLQHWPNAGLLLLVGTISICILYSINFIKKKSIKLLDVIKLIYVNSTLIAYLVRVNHWPLKEPLALVSGGSCLLVLIVFYIQYYKEKEKDDITIAENGNDIFDYSNQENSNNINSN